jgi:hypothetical protein
MGTAWMLFSYSDGFSMAIACDFGRLVAPFRKSDTINYHATTKFLLNNENYMRDKKIRNISFPLIRPLFARSQRRMLNWDVSCTRASAAKSRRRLRSRTSMVSQSRDRRPLSWPRVGADLQFYFYSRVRAGLAVSGSDGNFLSMLTTRRHSESLLRLSYKPNRSEINVMIKLYRQFLYNLFPLKFSNNSLVLSLRSRVSRVCNRCEVVYRWPPDL